MHSKVISPRQHGRLVYHNRGSCRSLVGYLGHEAKDQQTTPRFFNGERSNIASEEVRETIDQNAQGLRRQQEKFYSLVLSPSEQELQHLSSDPKKLRAFAVQTMHNYAQNFRLPDKRLVAASDLVWFATIHQERKYKEGAQRGSSKAGSHAHIHIIVSAQDRTQVVRLNPRGRRSRFFIRDWQVQNGKSFQQMFGYQKATTSKKLTEGMPLEQQERHQQRIRDKVTYLNQYFVGSHKIAVEKALSIGKEQQYGRGFFFNLHRLTKQYQEGKLVNDPYRIMETGKDEKVSFPERTLLHLGRGAQAVGQEADEEDMR